MNTFLPYPDPRESARALDSRRLGKQRVEAIQILDILTGATRGRAWAGHPAVRMWAGYEPYLLRRYLRAMLDEWEDRGYKNLLCNEHYRRLDKALGSRRVKAPAWMSEALCVSHRSNLVRKLPEHYRRFWPTLCDDLPYLWPV